MKKIYTHGYMLKYISETDQKTQPRKPEVVL